MDLDESLESLEESGQTEAEAIDQATELEDYQSDLDEILGDDAQESDMESAYDSFMTENETDYDGFEGREAGGWDDTGLDEETDDLHSDDLTTRELSEEGFEVEDDADLEAEVIEMEIEEGDIVAYLVDEDDNEIGFVLMEDGQEVEYYYVEDDGDGGHDEDGNEDVSVMRADDEAQFDLEISKETIKAVTDDMNTIYRESREVVDDLKEALGDINDSLGFLKKH